MPLGFEKVAYNALKFPAPVDPGRILVVPMAQSVHERLKGEIRWRGDEDIATLVSSASNASGSVTENFEGEISRACA